MTDETRDRIDNSAVAYGKKFDQDYRGYAAEDWAEGATSEHPISYEEGRKAGIEEAFWHAKAIAGNFITNRASWEIFLKELDALKTVKV